jgi:hypothetical protein
MKANSPKEKAGLLDPRPGILECNAYHTERMERRVKAPSQSLLTAHGMVPLSFPTSFAQSPSVLLGSDQHLLIVPVSSSDFSLTGWSLLQ